MVCALYLIEKNNKTPNLVIALNVRRAHPSTPSTPHMAWYVCFAGQVIKLDLHSSDLVSSSRF